MWEYWTLEAIRENKIPSDNKNSTLVLNWKWSLYCIHGEQRRRNEEINLIYERRGWTCLWLQIFESGLRNEILLAIVSWLTDEIVATVTDDVHDNLEDAGDDCEQHSGHSNIFVNLVKLKVAVQNQLAMDFWTLEQSYFASAMFKAWHSSNTISTLSHASPWRLFAKRLFLVVGGWLRRSESYLSLSSHHSIVLGSVKRQQNIISHHNIFRITILMKLSHKTVR